MTDADVEYEPLTPVDVERRLRRLVSDLSRARQTLRDARDKEVAARHTFESAYRKTILGSDCPKVTRGGYTSAERDAWVAQRIEVQQRVYDWAKTEREAAEDHLRTLRDQAMVVMSLGRSVNQAYSMAGFGA